MWILSSLTVTALFAAVSCHVTVLRDGRWQVVPGRRPEMGGWDRFGFQSRPFGPLTGMGQFSFGLPELFQSPWNNDNMMWNYGFPQIPAEERRNPTQGTNYANGNHQNLGSYPWTQDRPLQNSANQLNPGVNNENSVSMNPNSPNPYINNRWNTLDTQSSNPMTGNQLPLIPNNDAPGQFGQFPSSSGMFGSPFNNQFQGNLNDATTDKFGQFQSNPSIFGSTLNDQFQVNPNSANMLDQGINNANSVTDIMGINSLNSNVNNPWNTLDTQSGNPVQEPSIGNRLPLPQNNAVPGQFGQLTSNQGLFGSQLSNRFPRNPNSGISFLSSSNSLGRRK